MLRRRWRGLPRGDHLKPDVPPARVNNAPEYNTRHWSTFSLDPFMSTEGVAESC